MKKIHLFIAALIATSLCSYGSIAFDDSSDAVYDGVWSAGQNGGTGFTPWSFSSSGSSGMYLDSTTPGENGFRTWANFGGAIGATRGFSSSLNSGETFKMNVGHFGGNNGELGITLMSGSASVYNLKLVSGATAWEQWDGSSTLFDEPGEENLADYHTTDNGNAKFEFTYNGGSSYSVSLLKSDGDGFGYVNTFTASTDISAIDAVVIYNNGGGGGNYYAQ